MTLGIRLSKTDVSEKRPARMCQPPVAIGGVGGSGTRLIADIVRKLGVYLGGDLNESTDNLWFTFLFKRWELACEKRPVEFEKLVPIFLTAMVWRDGFTNDQEQLVMEIALRDRPQHSAVWLKERAATLLAEGRKGEPYNGHWGWKEPNTHVFLDHLQEHLPDMHYIHVMRNGLDMAYSSNQNQPSLWGPLFLNGEPNNGTPRYSLRFWCAVHRRIIRITSEIPTRFLLFNYDQFCLNPVPQLDQLVRFLRVDPGENVDSLLSSVRPPPSIERHRKFGLTQFDKDDVEYVQSLGFCCD